MTYEYQLDFIIVGDTGVGKSCMMLQFTNNNFASSHNATVGVDFGFKIVKIENKNVKLHIWDSAGQESFKTITRSYMKDRAAAIIVYDITNRKSFENVRKWIDEIRTAASEETLILLVANKSDLTDKRVVSESEGQQLAYENNLNFMETSAKTTDEGCSSCFVEPAKLFYQKIKEGKINVSQGGFGVKIGPQHKDFRITNDIYSKVEVEDTSYCFCF